METLNDEKVMNILMIGNSYCFYYVEELYGMAEAAGIKMRVCNLYYDGCPMNNHLNWWRQGEKKYRYYETFEQGRKRTDNVDLEWALSQQQWDVISFQLGGREMRNYTIEESLEQNREARNVLYAYVRERFPAAKLYFHQTWTFEIGHTKKDGFVMRDLNQQIAYTAKVRAMADGICQENKVARINTGDAWEIYRNACNAAGIAHNLCARLGKSDGTDPHGGDGTHDGDIGGGQLLNAAVWYEILVGLDCRETTYRPAYIYDDQVYTLNETMVEMLLSAAHKAVADVLPTYSENN
jgi:hypothetical protein